jgi:phosphoribosylamine--glycine ligase
MHERLKGSKYNPRVRGVLYMAYMATKEGVKVIEVNSRFGDPEAMNIFPVLKDDFVEVCYRILDGKLKKIDFEKKATVVIYAVPLSYGGYARYSGVKKVNLAEAEKLKEIYGDDLRIYPGSMELRGSETYSLDSRTVAAVGAAKTLSGAREISIGAIRKIDGPLRHREDVGLEEYVARSKKHMRDISA